MVRACSRISMYRLNETDFLCPLLWRCCFGAGSSADLVVLAMETSDGDVLRKFSLSSSLSGMSRFRSMGRSED